MKSASLQWQRILGLPIEKKSVLTGKHRFIPVFLCLFSFLMPVGEVLASLKLCNKTGSRVGIAIGYHGESEWITEGWWNVSPDKCEIILTGNLTSRFYYVYAVDYDKGGEWGGKSYMCTQDKSFSIHGAENCRKRGYNKTGFMEIDTENAPDWTVKLNVPESNKP